MSNFVEKICDKLMYQYLIENGFFENAEELKKIRGECTENPIDLNGDMKISDFLPLSVVFSSPV